MRAPIRVSELVIENELWEVCELALTRTGRRLLAWAIGLAALGVIGWYAVPDSGPGMDRASYEKGYDAFGGAYLARGETDDRDVDRAYCTEFWGQWPSSELAGVVKDDWIEGCADAREGKESRFK